MYLRGFLAVLASLSVSWAWIDPSLRPASSSSSCSPAAFLAARLSKPHHQPRFNSPPVSRPGWASRSVQAHALSPDGEANLMGLMEQYQQQQHQQAEAERIMKQLEMGAELSSPQAGQQGGDGTLKYMPSTEDGDPIVQALKGVLKANTVNSLELLDSRWNGNEVFRYETDSGPFFVKINRVEDPSVFLTEAVSLSAIATTRTITCPKPLHLGRLPKVGDVGPGAFMVLDYLPLLPFGIMRPDMQRRLGLDLAALHLSPAHEGLHQGRFGFTVSNFLALTPLDNTWSHDWADFFARRVSAQLDALHKDKLYGRRALEAADTTLIEHGRQVVSRLPELLSGVQVRPSLIHGDLWVGNAGATKDGPAIFDPACFFGHHEMELAMMTLFGGFRSEFWDSYHSVIPKGPGFARRQRVYQFYYYLNQLNLFGAPDVKDVCERLAQLLAATPLSQLDTLLEQHDQAQQQQQQQQQQQGSGGGSQQAPASPFVPPSTPGFHAAPAT